MKPKCSPFKLRLLPLYAAIFASGFAPAAVITWDGGGINASWATGANWSTDTVPGADDLVFGSAFGSGTTVDATAANITANSLTLDTATAFTLATAARTLTLTTGKLTRTAASSNNQIISGRITLGANGIWDINGSGTLTVSAVVNDGGSTFSITKNGSGNLVLSGVGNGYDGGTIVNAGSLTFSGTLSSSNSGAIVNGGTLIFDYSTNNTDKLSSALTLSGGTLQLTGGTYTEGLTGGTTITAGASAITRSSGTSILQQASLTRSTAGGTLNYGAAGIATTTTTNTNGILGGWATLGGSNWAINSTNLSNGPITALASYTSDTWGATTNTTVTANSAQTDSTTNSLRFNAAGAYTVTLAGINTITSGGLLVTGNVGNNLSTISGGTLRGTSGRDLIIIQNNTSNGLSIASVIADNTSATALTKSGAGLLTLTGTNTFTGATYLNQGTLSISANANLGAPTSGAALNLDGGTLQATATFGLFNGTAGTNNRALTLAANGGTLAVSAANTLSVAGVISGTGALTKSDAGTLALSGTNTYTGTTTVTGGVLRLDVASALPGGIASTGGTSNLILNGGVVGLGTGDFQRALGTAAANIQFTGSGGFAAYTADRTVNLGGAAAGVTWAGGSFVPTGSSLILGASDSANTLTFQNPIAFNGAARTVQVDNGSAATDAILSGVLSGTGSSGLTKTGAGTLALTATNTYSGVTTVSAGTLSIAADGGLGTAPVSVTAGLLVLNGGTLATTADITLSSTRGLEVATASSLNVGAGTTLTYGGIATGAGDLTKAGTGTLTLTGQNTLSGAVTISGGTLQIGNNTAGGSIAGTTGITISNGAAVVFNRTGSHTYANIISGVGGTLTQAGSGTLVLTGVNTYSGATTISGGTLQIGDGISDGSIATSSGITNNATLAYNLAGSRTYANTISGSGALIKSGAGTLTLTGTNTYAGVTTINGGTLSIAADRGLGAVPGSATAGQLVLSGGTLAVTETITLESGRGITTGGALDVASGKTLTYGGIAAGTGVLTKTGAGALVLTGANSYTGATTISGGTLQLGDGITNGSIAAASSITANGALIYNVVGSQTSSNSIGGNGTLTKAGTGTLIFTGVSSFSGAVTISGGTLQLGDGTTNGVIGTGSSITNDGTLVYKNNLASVNFSRVLGGTGAFTMDAGSGKALTMSGANTYSGITTVASGTLKLGNASALGGTGAGTTVASGATLDLLGQAIGAEALTLSGSLINSDGTAASLSGAITLAANSSAGGAGELTLSGGISGGAFTLTKDGAGILNLGGTNTYTGTTAVSTGTLHVSGTLAAGSSVTVASGATLSGTGTVGGSVSVATGSGVITAGDGTSGQLTLSGGLSFAGTGTINIGTLSNYTTNPALAVAGTLTLSGGAGAVTLALPNGAVGNATYHLVSHTNALADLTGLTVTGVHIGSRQVGTLMNTTGMIDYLVEGGYPVWKGTTGSNSWDAVTANTNWQLVSTVTANNGGATFFQASDAVLFDDSASDKTVNIATSVTPVSVTFNNSSGNDYTLQSSGGSITTGNLIKSGSGTLTITHANTFADGTTVNAGTLRVGNDAALGTGLITLDGGTLSANDTTARALSNNLAIHGDVTLGNATDSGALTFSGAVDLNGITRVVTVASAVTLSGVLSGTDGGLTKAGAGTLTLSNTNIYSGDTNLAAGTLAISSATSLGGSTSMLNFTGTSTLQLNAGFSAARDYTISSGQTGTIDTQAYAFKNTGVISGAGNLNKDGSGTLTLTGVSTYSGATTISAGTLQIGDGTTDGSIATTSGISIATGGVLVYNLTGNRTLSALVSGAGSFEKTGAGTLTMTHDNTYSGATVITQGTLILGDGTTDGAFASTSFTNNGTFIYNRNHLDETYAGAVTGTGAMIKQGGFKLTLSGTNTFSGALAINAGTLSIATYANLGAAATGATLTINGATLQTTTNDITFDDSGAHKRAIVLGSSGGTFDTATAGKFLAVTGDVSGSGALTKTGAGTLTLSGTNTYSGTTTVSAGTLGIAADGNLGAGTLVLDGGTLAITPTTDIVLSSTRDIVLTKASTIDVSGYSATYAGIVSGVGGFTKTGAGTLELYGRSDFDGNITLNGGTLEINSALSLGDPTAGNGDLIFTGNGTLKVSEYSATIHEIRNYSIASGKTATFDTNGKVLSHDGVISGAGALTKTSAGTMELAGSNTFGGKTEVRNGTLAFTNGDASATANQALGTNASVDLGVAGSSSGVLEYTGSAAASLAKNINALGNGSDTIRNNGGGLLTLAGTLTKNGTVLTLQGGSNGITVSGTIAGSAANSDLVIDGGTTTLTAANTYNGPTFIINGATLNANATDALPTADGRSAIVMDASGTGGSTLALGVAQSVASLTGAAGSVVNLNASTLTLGTSAASTTFAGVISGSGGLVKDGASTQVLSGANTFSGTTLVSAGTLQLGNNLALHNSTLDTSGAGAINLTGFTTPTLGGLTGSTALAAVITTGYSGVTALTLNPGAGVSDSYSGVIANGASGMSLTKTGDGTQVLGGANTYTGGTTISAGALVVNGSLPATGSVSVSGTLAGSGSIGGATTIQSGGTHAPGAVDAVGTQSFASDLNYASGSIFEWDLNQNSDIGMAYDMVGGDGNVTVDTNDTTFRIVFGASVDMNDAFWSTPFVTRQWAMTSIFGSAFTGAFSTVETSGPVNPYGSFAINGSNLTYTAVPEPSSAFVGLLIGAGLLRRRRDTAGAKGRLQHPATVNP